MNELKYALKLLSKNYRFSLLCISVIAIGVGILVPFYSLMSSIVPDELPLVDGEKYIVLQKRLADKSQFDGDFGYDNFHYQYFKNNTSSFSTLNVWRNTAVSIGDGEYSESFSGAELEPELLQVTGIQPIRGRIFNQSDAAFGAEPVAIISHSNWQSYYSGREDIIGHSSRINGETRTIIGVMPEEFSFPIFHSIWLPLSVPDDATLGAGPADLYIVGILADGVSITDASQEVSSLQAQISSSWGDDYPNIESSSALPYPNITGGTVFGPSLLFVTVILLILFNSANLFVVRGEERIEELAIRSAMGADHRRIAQALMLESFLICCIGLIAGLALGYFGIVSLEAVITNIIPAFTSVFWWDMSLDIDIVLGSCVIALAIWAASGGLPAWRIGRTTINELINKSGNGLGGAGTTKTSKILVNVQLIISCMLLTTGIFTTLTNYNTITTKLENSSSLYTGIISFADNDQNSQSISGYLRNFELSLSNQPGVEEIGFSTSIPGRNGTQAPYNIEDQDLQVNESYPQQFSLSVSDNFFDMFGIDIVQGRSFNSGDTSGSLPVAIVDQRLVDALWPEEQAIGKRIQLNPEQNSPWMTIVGIAEPQTQEQSLQEGETGSPVLYRPIRQSSPSQLTAIFYSSEPSIDYQRTIQVAGTQANRDIPITQVQSVAQLEENTEYNIRFNRDIGIIFLIIALYLTVIATYGLAARAISRRQQEMGVRMALGAGRTNCLAVILKDGVLMVLTGLTVGGALAILVTYLVLTALSTAQISSFVLDDLISTAVLVGISMGSLVLLANYFPATKIVAMEPGEALHYE